MSQNNEYASDENVALIDPSEIPVRPAIYIRVSPEEYRLIATDAKTTGETLPDLIKRVYFSNRKRVTVLMKKQDLDTVLGQLGRIGNNLNQVARALNSGFRAGFNDDLAQMRKAFDQLLAFMTQRYRNSAAAY